MKKSDKILTTKSDILDYIDIKADHLVEFLFKFGLPVLILNGRWYAHKDNLDEFMRRLTAQHQTIDLKDQCPSSFPGLD